MLASLNVILTANSPIDREQPDPDPGQHHYRTGVDPVVAPIPIESPVMRAAPLESELLMFFSFQEIKIVLAANHRLQSRSPIQHHSRRAHWSLVICKAVGATDVPVSIEYLLSLKLYGSRHTLQRGRQRM